MNKADFIAAIAEKAGTTKTEVIFSATFDTIIEALVKQEKIAIPRFGSFAIKVREERKGRNPSSGKEITIPKAVVIHFKASEHIKEMLNNRQQE